MIPLTWREELSRRRVYDRLESRETFRVIGVVSSRDFSDSCCQWTVFEFLCASSFGGYVLAKETHQFPADSSFSCPFGEDSFYGLDLIDLTQEEADQYRFLLKQTWEDSSFRKPPLFM